MVDERQDKSAEIETAKNKNKSSITQNLLKSFNNFSISLREARERETTPTEKIVWFLLFTSCFLYCGLLIWRSYWKWMKSPSIVMLTANDESIREIPFPAVMVCPERKIISAVFNYDDYISNKANGNLTEEQQNMFEDLSLICDFNNHVNDNERKFSLANETVNNIRKASTNVNQVIYFCSWKGKETLCSDMFSPVLTEEGICFTFNTIGPEDLLQLENLNTDYEYMEKLNRTRNQGWSSEYGYSSEDPKTYPMRGSGAGPKAGLELSLVEMVGGLDRDCKESMTSGFKILLQTPSDLPRPSQHYIRVPTYRDVTIAFTPTMELTSDGLEVFRPTARQCYFEDERSLQYFKLYTQSNCEHECLANFTYARCGCVHFSMPHDPKMAICNFRKLNCTSKAEMELSTMYIEDVGEGNFTIEEAMRIADDCTCLPACTSITYETEVIQSELHKREKRSYDLLEDNQGGYAWTVYKTSKVVIFFKKALFDVVKRSELYGTSDILASCGGLLGLFMGFSVINIIEILYFCILRFCRRHPCEKCEHSKIQTAQKSKDK